MNHNSENKRYINICYDNQKISLFIGNMSYVEYVFYGLEENEDNKSKLDNVDKFIFMNNHSVQDYDNPYYNSYSSHKVIKYNYNQRVIYDCEKFILKFKDINQILVNIIKQSFFQKIMTQF